MIRGMLQRRAAAAAQQGAGGTQIASDMPLGAGVQEAAGNKQSAELLTTHDTAAASYPQTIFPYVQALTQYGRGITTAPGADLLNTAKGWINGVARSFGWPEPTSSTQSMDTLHKWLQQIITTNPVAAGSDARLAAVLAGNANTGIHELAGEDMIKAGVALQRMTAVLNSQWHDMAPQQQAQQYGGSYLNFLRAQAPTIDVRALARDLYNPQQLKDLRTSLNQDTPDARRRFLDTLQMGRDSGFVTSGGVRAMP
jgi:hypothetical protein